MYIENLCIEVTRKCNMRCAHCLRGNAQNINIDKKYISELLLHCRDSEIGCITFTGGEPTLNIDAIEFTLQTMRWLNIRLGSFYVVTNAKVYRKRLVDLLDEAYTHCTEKELCGLAISDDEFHGQYQSPNFNFNYYRYKYDEYDCEREYFRPNDKKTDFSRVILINEGRAKDLTDRRRRDNNPSECIDDRVHRYNTDENIGGTLYLNALGYLVDGCDWSYETQSKQTIASVMEWDKFLSKITVDDAIENT